MKIICAETVLLGQDAFIHAGTVEVIPDREIRREHLLEADALIIRSKTKITPELIEDTPIRFIGTATAGTDHMNLAYLKQKNIHACSAPGCNANSVGEYITAALLTLSNRTGECLKNKTIGIIGCGNVGKRVIEKCAALGMNILRNDPPLEAETQGTPFIALEKLLAESDIVTLHVPFINEGPWPTDQMANADFFRQLKPNAIFINASRGNVVDYDALLEARKNGTVSQMVIDVWDPEPAFRTDIMEIADLATPHIAGHSYEGKLNGTIQVYQAYCNFFGIKPTWDIQASLPAPEHPNLQLQSPLLDETEALHSLVRTLYNIEKDDRLLRKAAVPQKPIRAQNFDALRKNYRRRREFMHTCVEPHAAPPKLKKTIQALGFQIT